MVCADEPLLEQMLVNLLTNTSLALEKSSGLKRIDLSLEQTPQEAVIRISDSGPGVPPHIQEKVFEPFFTTRVDGSGLGLSICQRIITDHGGVIEVSASPLGGAEFIVRLPLKDGKRLS